MHFSPQTLVLATIGLLELQCALAQPYHKHHHHQHKRVDFNNKDLYKDVDWDAVFHKTDKSQPDNAPTGASSSPVSGVSPTPTPTDDGAPSTSLSPNPAKPTGDGVSTGGASGSGFGGRSTPKDDGVKDHYIGNVGIPYGSNMKFISESEDNKYKYTNQFCSESKEKITVIVWNKSGIDGQPQSGMSLPPNLKFDLGPGECRYVAFDENTQAAFSQDCARDPLKGNLPQCPWGEVDFGNQQNGGWSGYDRSTIVTGVNSGVLTISCEGAETSSQEENSFTSASQTNAGGSKPPGEAHFKTKIGD